MWIRIRAVIIEDEPLAAQYLSQLLDDTCQVEVVGSATESEAGLRLCAELRPDAVKTVTIVNNAFDCLKVHDGMPSDLDERIAA